VEGEQAKLIVIKEFLMASTYAGIAFGNAGTAAVHALSYPFSGAFHIPHGEANYTIMFGVLRKYASLLPEGKLRTLNQLLARNLVCKEEALYEELDELFEIILPRKTLKSYGASRNQLEEFADSVMKNQGRLMANNYVELSREDVFDIYQSLY
jgi:4-hydroxybutyrate dehydrogenase